MSSASRSKRPSSAWDALPDSSNKRKKVSSNSTASHSQTRYSQPAPRRRFSGRSKKKTLLQILNARRVRRKLSPLSKASSGPGPSRWSPSSSSTSCSTSSPSSPSAVSESSSYAGTETSSSTDDTLPHQERVVALDCEMVGVRVGLKERSALARCSIIDYDGEVIFDEFVKPEQQIIAYRTCVSGIRRSDLVNAMPFRVAIKKIHKILQNKIIIGHHLQYDFEVLKLSHPVGDVRDTSEYVPVRALAGLQRTQRPSLKKLAANILHETIQEGSHCSVTDATTALNIYKRLEKKWEAKR